MVVDRLHALEKNVDRHDRHDEENNRNHYGDRDFELSLHLSDFRHLLVFELDADSGLEPEVGGDHVEDVQEEERSGLEDYVHAQVEVAVFVELYEECLANSGLEGKNDQHQEKVHRLHLVRLRFLVRAFSLGDKSEIPYHKTELNKVEHGHRVHHHALFAGAEVGKVRALSVARFQELCPAGQASASRTLHAMSLAQLSQDSLQVHL